MVIVIVAGGANAPMNPDYVRWTPDSSVCDPVVWDEAATPSPGATESSEPNKPPFISWWSHQNAGDPRDSSTVWKVAAVASSCCCLSSEIQISLGSSVTLMLIYRLLNEELTAKSVDHLISGNQSSFQRYE